MGYTGISVQLCRRWEGCRKICRNYMVRKSYLVYRDLSEFKENRREMKVEFEEVELSEAAEFNKHHGLGSFPFADLFFLAFVDSSVSATVAGRNTGPPHPMHPGCDMVSLHTWEREWGQRGGEVEGFISVNNNRDIVRVFKQPSKSRYQQHLETSPHLYWHCSHCRNVAKFVSASGLVFLVKAFFFMDR